MRDESAEPPLRLAFWSGPRNLSTALMRSFENRADTVVVDEPLYGHYLAATGIAHPMRDEVLSRCETDWRAATRALHAPLPGDARCFYQKHMAHHLLPEVGREWLDGLTHAFLIRDPRAMLASLHAKYPNPVMADTGLEQQVELFERRRAATGEIPVVVDADELLRAPEAVLRVVCARVGLAFDPAMLTWPAGRRETDGVWGEHWYGSVEASTGFGPPRASRAETPPALEPLARECEALHAVLHPHRVRAN